MYQYHPVSVCYMIQDDPSYCTVNLMMRGYVCGCFFPLHSVQILYISRHLAHSIVHESYLMRQCLIGQQDPCLGHKFELFFSRAGLLSMRLFIHKNT